MWWRKEDSQLHSLLGRLNTLLHSQPTQAVSSLHGIILPWNQRTLCFLHPAEKTNAALPMDCKGGREGERALCLPCFSLTPTLCSGQMQGDMQLHVWTYRLQDRKKVDGPFFFLLLYMELLSVFPGCSLCRLMNNRSEETERLFTCQPQSSGCVVSPAAVDDTLTTLAALELHSYAVTGEAGPRAWTKVLAGKWRSNQYQRASFASVRLSNV